MNKPYLPDALCRHLKPALTHFSSSAAVVVVDHQTGRSSPVLDHPLSAKSLNLRVIAAANIFGACALTTLRCATSPATCGDAMLVPLVRKSVDVLLPAHAA